MNKFLKALVLGLGLVVSVNANSAAWALIILNNKPQPAVSHDKWFALCDYAKIRYSSRRFWLRCERRGSFCSRLRQKRKIE